MGAIEQAIVKVSGDLASSTRWQNPNDPGSVHVKELAEHLNNPSEYRAFRETGSGAYYLGIIESYQDAFNDDWLPFEIIGLVLWQAREFIAKVRDEVTLHCLDGAVPMLRAHYSRLAKAENPAAADNPG